MAETSTDRIEKEIVIRAPRSRVRRGRWRSRWSAWSRSASSPGGGAVDPKQDYSAEPTTLVVFELEEVPEGTRLKVTESGFDRIPLARRSEAFRSSSAGWAEQVQNIARYVAPTL